MWRGVASSAGCVNHNRVQRSGKNIGRYFGETIEIRAVLADIEAVAKEHGWISEEYHRTAEFKWTALHRLARSTQPGDARRIIYIAAGIHGDEPAGPLAVRELLREDRWPDNTEIHLIPCLNPGGFTANTRENLEGVDLNRDYRDPKCAETRAHIAWLERQPRFDWYLCLHEDWESQGFYLYEQNPTQQTSYADRIIAAVEQVCPIDQSAMIEGREAQGGVIRPNISLQDRPQWPEAFYLITHKSRLGYTLEAPSDFPLPVRVAAEKAGVRAVLGV
jgi:predicted deacylase